jgi:hypothetical protein
MKTHAKRALRSIWPIFEVFSDLSESSYYKDKLQIPSVEPHLGVFWRNF